LIWIQSYIARLQRAAYRASCVYRHGRTVSESAGRALINKNARPSNKSNAIWLWVLVGAGRPQPAGENLVRKRWGTDTPPYLVLSPEPAAVRQRWDSVEVFVSAVTRFNSVASCQAAGVLSRPSTNFCSSGVSAVSTTCTSSDFSSD